MSEELLDELLLQLGRIGSDLVSSERRLRAHLDRRSRSPAKVHEKIVRVCDDASRDLRLLKLRLQDTPSPHSDPPSDSPCHPHPASPSLSPLHSPSTSPPLLDQIQNHTPSKTKSAPIEGEPLPVETESVNADTESAPAETKSVNAETESSPADTESIIADIESVLADIESVIAEAELAPAETESAPAEAQSLIAETESSPAEIESVSIAGTESAPAGTESVSIAGTESAPAETESISIAGTESAPAQTESVSIAGTESASAETESVSTEAESTGAETKPESDKPKPLLKCVNIETLLKPTILNSLKTSSDLETKPRLKRNISPKKPQNKSYNESFRSRSRRNVPSKISQDEINTISDSSESESESGRLSANLAEQIKSNILQQRCECRVSLVSYLQDMKKIRGMLRANGVTRLYDRNLQVVWDDNKISMNDIEDVKKSLIESSSSGDELKSVPSSIKRKTTTEKSLRKHSKSSDDDIEKEKTVLVELSSSSEDEFKNASSPSKKKKSDKKSFTISNSSDDSIKNGHVERSNSSREHSKSSPSSTKRTKLTKRRKKSLNSSDDEIKRLTSVKKKRKNIILSDDDDECNKTTDANCKSSNKKIVNNKKSNDNAGATNSDLTPESDTESIKDSTELQIPNVTPSAAENEMITEFFKSTNEKAMSHLASDLLNDDTSNSDEELPKVNGKVKKSRSIKNSDKEGNGTDSGAKSKSKKSVTSKNSDSDSDKMCENEDVKFKAENSDDSVKEVTILGDTDSDDSEIRAPIKKKRKKTGDASSDDSPVEQKTKKKRRRIKNMSGDDSDKSDDKSDDSDGSDDEGESNKKGRKNIRKVKRSDNLDEATKIAARNERNRLQRIAERQKLYNESMFDESGRPDEVVKLDKVILDFDPETKEPLISVDLGLVEKLKPHQANGVKFMWDACFESVKQIKDSKGSGCILAHCMGLGKTLQVVTLTHTLLSHKKLTKVERVLVVCPLSTVHNWVNEYKMWLKHTKRKSDIEIFEISKYKQNYERSSKLKDWLESGGVCVLGYDMFRNLSAENNKKFRKAQLTAFQRALVDPGPDLVVCDEGHLLKNEKTSLSQSMNRVKTLRRIVLTGTPLQNNLKEYYCMVQFVKPNLLGKYNEYLNRFVNPITNGQYTDSTEHDIRIMKRRSHVLHKMLDGGVQRRDYAVLAPFLPPKHEYVLFISLTEIQIKLYSYYMENFSRRPQPDRKNTGFLFPDFQAMQRIWTHPLVLKANSERYEYLQQKKREREDEDSEGSLVDFIDDDSTTTEESSESDESTEDSDGSEPKNKKKKGKPKKAPQKRVTRATAVSDDEVIEVKAEEPRQDNPTEWWKSLCSEDELDHVRHSNKLIILLDILKQCEAIGDKLLVFSQSLYSLDLIEQFLWKIDEATQKSEENEKLAGHVGSWSAGLDYFRLDGSTSCENRAIWCKNFNSEDNPRARLFLISTRAGGLGINLVAANRVIIFDMSWNPSHDVQSIFRVYRFGQKKPCYVYRFLALGTMEEKIYERQVTKQAISKRVIDEQQIDRHYAESDLAELYTFCPVPEGPREVPKLPKDRLFADLLKQHDTVIYKYHEHDSLLENKEEETLTEEERKAAWEDYENEKTRPPPVFGSQIMAGYQQQQQHHLAMSAVLQQEFPGLSEQQVASMIPSILQTMYQNGDQALSQQMYPGYDLNMMQKMNAMLAAQNSLMGFKYPQNSMLNNSLLNAGTGAGSTNFQTTWQQQQQIQLERLQHQQAMQANLKYYAGGLGSRDTVDMAALQQRQRAMLMGTAGIPQRGRPPKHTNLMQYPILPSSTSMTSAASKPPVTTGDIVDLDSE